MFGDSGNDKETGGRAGGFEDLYRFILGVTKMMKISIEHIREAANVNSLETNVKRQGWDGLDVCRGGTGAMLDI